METAGGIAACALICILSPKIQSIAFQREPSGLKFIIGAVTTSMSRATPARIWSCMKTHRMVRF